MRHRPAHSRTYPKTDSPVSAASSLESGAALFLDALEAQGCAPGTAQAYRTDLSQFALFLHPRMSAKPAWGLRDVGTDHVLVFIEDLRDRGRKPRTIARKVASVRSCFRLLCSVGVLESNPAIAVNVAAVARGSESLQRDGIEDALGERGDHPDFRSARDRAILEILYGAGLRLRELVGLNLSSLNMEEGSLRLQEKDDERIVPMESRVSAAIASYLICRADQLVDRDITQIDAGALFVNERGLRLHRRTVQRIVARGLPRGDAGGSATPQLLRSSFATHLLDAGIPAGGVQARLGQTSLPVPARAPASLEQLRAMYNRAHPRAYREANISATEVAAE